MTLQNETEISDFDRVAAALTVRSICTEQELLDEVPVGCDIAEAIGMIGNDPRSDSAKIVDSHGSIIGFVWHKDLDVNASSLTDVMEELNPGDFVSADTSILDVLDLFCASDKSHFYVLEMNKVIGIVSFPDLYKAPGRLAFLALALEIESLALRLCQLPNLCVDCWSSLANTRKQKAIKHYIQHFDQEPEYQYEQIRCIQQLIMCTLFIDKARMIFKRKLIPGSSLREIMKVFHELQDVRDLCAHPGREIDLEKVLPRDRLQEFVESSKRIYKSLKISYHEKLLKSLLWKSKKDKTM